MDGSHHSLEITFNKSWRKSQIKNTVINALARADILGVDAFELCDDKASPLDLMQLELPYAREKEERERKERLETEEMECKRLKREEREQME